MSKKFDKLANHVTKYYEAKGVPPEKAKEWGDATAGKVYQEQKEGEKKDE
jgi:hypothetical protein